MIVSLKQGADAAAVKRELAARGLWVSRVEIGGRGAALHYVIAAHSAVVDPIELAQIEGVGEVSQAASAHPLVDAMGSFVEVGGERIGGGRLALLFGPCSVESEAHVARVAERLASRGVRFLRGGAFKPRTNPYDFQGHGEKALRWLRKAADAVGMKVVTEALSELDVPAVAEHADLVQVGSRNMQNFALLKAVGRAKKPVLLKRAMAGTIEEWLSAAEYLLASGAPGVVFCERGVRGFDDSTRNVLDLGAVALLANVRRVPVVVDPSHGAGRRDLVLPLARAALAAGASGLMIETHDDPGRAMSDGPQAVPLEDLLAFAEGLGPREARASAPVIRLSGGAS